MQQLHCCLEQKNHKANNSISKINCKIHTEHDQQIPQPDKQNEPVAVLVMKPEK